MWLASLVFQDRGVAICVSETVQSLVENGSGSSGDPIDMYEL